MREGEVFPRGSLFILNAPTNLFNLSTLVYDVKVLACVRAGERYGDANVVHKSGRNDLSK